MFLRSKKRLAAGVAICVFVIIFLVPFINVNRYRLSVGKALSQALGREVTVQGVTLQTFPQPGLLLNGLVVADDPTVSAEPVLRADEVLATIRLSSLWRGQLEIGSLKLKYPSVNLVRTLNGRWNLESLLERARQIPSAPTAKTSPESRPRFPYIEADSARINLKVGQEKKVFALNDADFALWLASEDEWRMRLEARPVRTDANLTDTGTLKLQGSWRRAASLHETPFQFRVWWDDGQLGQLTSLIYGHDRGWRGSVRGSATIRGTPGDMKIAADGRIDDFRRYDIITLGSLSLQAHCDAQYSFSAREVSGFHCKSPMGGGLVEVSGSFGIMPHRNVDVTISAENIPAQFLATLLRHAKKDVPEDLSASGNMSASFVIHSDQDGTREWIGNGESSDLQVRSSVLSKPLLIATTKWHLIGPDTEFDSALLRGRKNSRSATHDALPKPETRAFLFQPVSLSLGGSSPAILQGWFGRENYAAELKGEVDLEQLMQAAKLIGLPTPATEFTGNAKGKLELAGSWAGFGLPEITGSAQLHGVTAKLRGVASPLKIQSAQFSADHDSLSLTKISASFPSVHSNLNLSVTWPRRCSPFQESSASRCDVFFDLKADELNVDEINSLLNPKAQKSPWYAAIANTVLGRSRSSLPPIYASGRFTAGKVIVKDVTAQHVSGNMTITPTSFLLDTVQAKLLGGDFVGDISGDFSHSTPVYSSTGNLITLSVANLAALTHDAWGVGKLTASYKGTSSGWDADQIISSLKGSANFQWRDGVMHRVNLESDGSPLKFKVFSGKLELNHGALILSDSKLQAGKSIYVVSGTASLGRDLQFNLTRDGGTGFAVSGTLAHPKVAAFKVPETQAKLK